VNTLFMVLNKAEPVPVSRLVGICAMRKVPDNLRSTMGNRSLREISPQRRCAAVSNLSDRQPRCASNCEIHSAAPTERGGLYQPTALQRKTGLIISSRPRNGNSFPPKSPISPGHPAGTGRPPPNANRIAEKRPPRNRRNSSRAALSDVSSCIPCGALAAVSPSPAGIQPR
jgi:hypothetical protein